jgi:hypothetical protein
MNYRIWREERRKAANSLAHVAPDDYPRAWLWDLAEQESEVLQTPGVRQA